VPGVRDEGSDRVADAAQGGDGRVADVALGGVQIGGVSFALLALGARRVKLLVETSAQPLVLAAESLIGSIAEGFDAAAFADAGGSPHVGIVNTSGIIPIDATAGWCNLDPFATAEAALRNVGAVATAVYIHPLDYKIAALMNKSTDSNESLLGGQAPPTQAPAESVLGVPAYQSTAVPRHNAIVAQANELVVVRRSDMEVAVDENYKFDTVGVGIRTIARLKLVVAQSAAVVVISLPTS
jgi:HK97 family phage major capsid protein